jgi:hypothetical protein
MDVTVVVIISSMMISIIMVTYYVPLYELSISASRFYLVCPQESSSMEEVTARTVAEKTSHRQVMVPVRST